MKTFAFLVLWAVSTIPLVGVSKAQERLPNVKMVYRTSHRATYTKQWNYRFPGYESSRWIIALRYPPELAWSKNVEATAELETSSGWVKFEKVTENSPEHRAMLKIDYPHNDPILKSGFSIRTTISATICHQELLKGKAARPPSLTETERDNHLRPTETYDFEAPSVKAWMSKHRLWKQTGEEDIEFSLRVYRFLRQNIPYSTADGGPWRCSVIIQAGFGECCRQAILGTAILRANKIPARTVCALWAIDTNSQAAHCWGEVFIKGVGWIPYDTTIDSDNKLTDRYFGSKKGELLGGMTNFDWEIDVPNQGQKTVFAIDFLPAYWSEGRGPLSGPAPTMKEEITNISIPR